MTFIIIHWYLYYISYNIRNNCIYKYKINQHIYKCFIIITNGAMTFVKVMKTYSYRIESFIVQMSPINEFILITHYKNM